MRAGSCPITAHLVVRPKLGLRQGCWSTGEARQAGRGRKSSVLENERVG